MGKENLFYQQHAVFNSFSTKSPKALINKVPWVISTATKWNDAVSRIFDDGHVDLIVLDPQTGGVLGLLSDFDNTTTLTSKKKKKKREITIGMQTSCHALCVTSCAGRGGCKNHVVMFNDKGEGFCVIKCNEGTEDPKGPTETVGQVLDNPKLL